QFEYDALVHAFHSPIYALKRGTRWRSPNVEVLLLHGADLLGDLGGQVVDLLLEAIAHLIAGEADDVEALGLLLDHLADADVRILDERLLEEADLLVELDDAALHHLLDDVFGLALVAGLGDEDLLLVFEVGRIDLLAAHVLRSNRGRGGDLQGYVVDDFLIGRALGLHQHADLAAHVDVAFHDAAIVAHEAADG